MRILKITAIIIISVLSLTLTLALFINGEYTVEREITINQPKKEVFDYIKLLKNSQNYSKWVSMDPNMKKEFKGVDGTQGFVYAWDSEMDNVGKGEQEIKSVLEGEKILYELRFIKPFEGIAKAFIATESITVSQTKVKWVFESKMPYPMNIMRLFIDMDEMLGKDLQTGLDNLKTALEK